jgi:RNA polymerase sigma-70 factor (ECF subfamily)
MTGESAPDPALLERYRDYLALLALLARLHWPQRSRSKLGASDIVQEALLKAAQNLNQVRGRSEAELAGLASSI